MTKTNTVQSVHRALDILEALGSAGDAVGVTELARTLDLKTPTTHNLLRTLAARRYVTQDQATQKYRLAAACATLGRMCRMEARVPHVAQAHLQALSSELNESVVLGMMERGETAFVAQVEAKRMLTVSFDQVWVTDSYSSVCGRVLLAYLSGDALAAYTASHPVSTSKAGDIRTKKALTAVLAEIREQAYCAYWRANGTVFAIAAPVFNADGCAVAAVGVPIPGPRVNDKTQPGIVRAVCEAARRISHDLGWQESSVSSTC